MGQVHLSQFEDDKQLSCLETILAFYPPIGNYLYKSKFYPETNFWNYVFMSHLPSQLRLAQEVMSGIYFFMLSNKTVRLTSVLAYNWFNSNLDSTFQRYCASDHPTLFSRIFSQSSVSLIRDLWVSQMQPRLWRWSTTILELKMNGRRRLPGFTWTSPTTSVWHQRSRLNNYCQHLEESLML